MKIRYNKENKLELYQSSKPIIVLSILSVLTFFLIFSSSLGISEPITYALALAILMGIGLISTLLPINQKVFFDKENNEVEISTYRLIGKKVTKYKVSDVKDVVLKSKRRSPGELLSQIFLVTKRKKLVPLSGGYSSNTKQTEKNFYQLREFLELS
jgi:hypothetical protein